MRTFSRQVLAAMPKILAVHASDANPILDTFRSTLEAGPISFLNVEEIDNTRQLRNRILELSRDIDVCLIFSSNFLARILRPLSSNRQRQPDRYLLSKSATLTLQLNLTQSPQAVRPLWRDLFHAVDIWPVIPLLQMQPQQLDQYVRAFGAALRESSTRLVLLREFRDGRASDVLHFRVDADVEALTRDLIADARVVELLFATNRAQIKRSQAIDFTRERSNTLSFGACQIRIPEDHKIGRLELPKTTSWIRLRFQDEQADERRHFVIKKSAFLVRSNFVTLSDVTPREPHLCSCMGLTQASRMVYCVLLKSFGTCNSKACRSFFHGLPPAAFLTTSMI